MIQRRVMEPVPIRPALNQDWLCPDYGCKSGQEHQEEPRHIETPPTFLHFFHWKCTPATTLVSSQLSSASCLVCFKYFSVKTEVPFFFPETQFCHLSLENVSGLKLLSVFNTNTLILHSSASDLAPVNHFQVSPLTFLSTLLSIIPHSWVSNYTTLFNYP